MPENLPVPAGAAAPPEVQVMLAALAKVSAEMLAQEANRHREVEPLTPERVEEIAGRVAKTIVAEVFGDFDVDLDDKESKRAFREDLSHARRARTWWDKAGAILATAIMTAISGGLIAAVVQYLSIRGGK